MLEWVLIAYLNSDWIGRPTRWISNDHVHIVAKREDFDLALLNTVGFPAAMRHVKSPGPAGNDMYETRVVIRLPPVAKYDVTLKGEALWHLKISPTWVDAFKVSEVEITKPYLDGGIIRVKNAHLAHEWNDAQWSGQYDYWRVTKATWDGWVWSKGEVEVIMPAGTGHTPPPFQPPYNARMQLAIAATLIGVLKVTPVKQPSWTDNFNGCDDVLLDFFEGAGTPLENAQLDTWDTLPDLGEVPQLLCNTQPATPTIGRG